MSDQLPDLEGGAGRNVESTPVLIVNPDGTFGGSAVDVQHVNGVTVAGFADALNADPERRALTVRNASDTMMTIRVDGEDAGSADYPLDALRGYEFPPNMVPKGKVSIYCETAGKEFHIMYASASDA